MQERKLKIVDGKKDEEQRKKPLLRRGIQLSAKGSHGLRRAQIIEPQGLVKRIGIVRCHVAAASYHIGVALFDFHGKVKQIFHHFFHLWHQTCGDLVVDDPETTPFFGCFSQFLILL